MKKEEKEILGKQMQDRILRAIAAKKIPIHRYYGDTVRFGYVTDTHIGSLYEHSEVLNAAYDVFEREGITRVYHSGDLCAGERMYRGQEYELYAHGFDRQVEAVISRYPERKGIKTYFITGNHDLSFFRTAGTDIGRAIAKERKDMVYLGQELADVLIGGKHKVHMQLFHPAGGTAYAISYAVQKYVESISGGQKPKIILIGHYHKAEYLPCYRNVFVLQGGCIEGQTPFMKRKKLAAHIGFWIVEFKVDKSRSVQRFKTEFFAHYEERQIQEV